LRQDHYDLELWLDDLKINLGQSFTGHVQPFCQGGL